jgi:TetR/AcrR family transcriptional regulator, transcriptional repressor for nem operon
VGSSTTACHRPAYGFRGDSPAVPALGTGLCCNAGQRGPVTDPGYGRTDGTRQQIMRAASRAFGQRPFNLVSLDDIVARAGLSKGAMYFHFQSKHALAMAVLDEQSAIIRAAFTERINHQLSGLESLIEATYFLALQDVHSPGIRAGLHLLEQMGRTDGVQAKIFTQWSPAITAMIQRGIADGDIIDGTDPDRVCRLIISIYMGLRQTADLDAPQEFFTHVESAWMLIMPGFTHADRLGYFVRFVKRCTVVAKNNASLPGN